MHLVFLFEIRNTSLGLEVKVHCHWTSVELAPDMLQHRHTDSTELGRKTDTFQLLRQGLNSSIDDLIENDGIEK